MTCLKFFLFQNFNLYRYVTAEDNKAFHYWAPGKGVNLNLLYIKFLRLLINHGSDHFSGKNKKQPLYRKTVKGLLDIEILTFS